MRATHKNANISGTIKTIYRNKHSGKLYCSILFDGDGLVSCVNIKNLNINTDEEFYLHKDPPQTR